MTSSHLALIVLTRLTAAGLIAAATGAAVLGIFAVHGGWQILADPIPTMLVVLHPDPQFTIRDAKSDRLPVLSEAPVVTIAKKEPEPIVLDRRALINEVQIAALKNRLQLTVEQQKHWPAVEAALRQFSYRFLQPKKKHPTRTMIDVSSLETQKLIQAAMPLLNELRQDQKREIRQLVRMIGLETVASQI